MARRREEPSLPIEPREFKSVEEIDAGIAKLERRVQEVSALDARSAALGDDGALTVVRSNVREAIREVFGSRSPEFNFVMDL